jgi:hypothetical protein
MKKIYSQILLLGLLSTMCMSMQAQDKGDDPYKEIYELKKSLDSKDKELATLQGKYEKLEANLDKAKEDLNNEKNSSKSAQIKELTQQLKEKDLAAKQSELDSSRKEEEYKTQLSQKEEKIKELTQEINELNNQLSDLSKFKRLQLKQLASSVEADWLNKPYSQIDMNNLKKACAEYKEYEKDDEDVKAASDKLSNLMNEALIYNEGMSCVSSIYDADRIQKAIQNIKDLHVEASTEKGQELKKLQRRLNDYEITVEIFVYVIHAVDGAINEGDSQEAAFLSVKVVLEEQEKVNGYISAIREYPWLSEQYDEYYNALSKDCFSANAAKNLILGLLQP